MNKTMKVSSPSKTGTIELILPKATLKRLGNRVMLNGYLFLNGVHRHTGPRNKIVGLIRYFERSFECGVRDVISEKIKSARKIPVVEVPVPAKPTPRQQTILSALEGIPQESWEGEPSHPSVAQVIEITKDLTVTLEEIIEVIECHMSAS